MDLLKNLYIKDISQIQPYDEQEKKDTQDAILWINRKDELCKPENMEKHLCAIFVILSKDRKKTFLIDHIKAKTWLPPGGHVEKGQTFIDAVKKEAMEELGIVPELISTHPFFLTQTQAKDKYGIHTDITLWFLVEGDENINYKVLEKEARDGKWFSVETVLDNKRLEFISRAFQKLNEMHL